ncbi:unknown [Clostridium sp. CAG:356]|nr:MAG: hypothetical protein BHW02_02865 [Clostridium sp. 28_12]CDD37466.1 unknown [Clostridium sp. CAG:356]
MSNRRSFFMKFTREDAKKQIEIKEKKLNRKLTPEEKHKIIKGVAHNAREKAIRASLAAFLGIGTIAAGVTAVRALNPGTEVRTETQSNTNETEKGKSFKEGILVEDKDEKEINALNTKEAIVAYLKNMYIEEYEKETGDTTLTTADIKIMESSQDYIYQLEDGTFVTHGQNPETTEMNMKENGEEYSTYTNEKGTAIESNVYSVRLNENDKILDMITEKDLKRTIPGDNYLEMKDYNSILEKMGNVVSKSYSLMNVVGAENISQATVDNYKKELLKAVKKYQIDNIGQTQDTTQQDVQKDDGMEIDD